MAVVPDISVDSFGGLDLSLPPGIAGPATAIDLLDVDWDNNGVLGSRVGVKQFTTKAPATAYDRIYGHGVDFLPLGEVFAILARRGKVLAWVNSAGEEGAGTIAVNEGRLSFAKISASVLVPVTYIANQEEKVRKFFEGAFSSPTATVDGVAGKDMPRANFLADWQDGANRLVYANLTLTGAPNAGAGSPSHVFFSEPGKPESFESTAFVELNPGDGEQIIGMCTYGRNVFVFKETCCFVFYGISQDVEGKPIFNFKTIDLGTRALGFFASDSQPLAVGKDGVYFLAQDGIWVTSGGPPVRVSDPLEMSSDRRDARATLGEMTFPTWTKAKGFLIQMGNCLYVGFIEKPTDILIQRMMKLDLATGRTTYWKTELNGAMAWASTFNGVPRLFFSGGPGHKGIFFFTPETNEDPVVAMNPYWQSGFYDNSNADEKTLTETKVWGSGEVNVSVAEDFKAFGQTKAFKLGAGNAIAQRQGSRGQSATFFSHKISGAAPWSVQRLTRYVREDRVPGTEKKS
jgi:hypothetical protein